MSAAVTGPGRGDGPSGPRSGRWASLLLVPWVISGSVSLMWLAFACFSQGWEGGPLHFGLRPVKASDPWWISLPVALFAVVSALLGAGLAVRLATRRGSIGRLPVAMAATGVGLVTFLYGFFRQADAPTVVGLAWMATGGLASILLASVPRSTGPVARNVERLLLGLVLAALLAAEVVAVGQRYSLPRPAVAGLVTALAGAWILGAVGVHLWLDRRAAQGAVPTGYRVAAVAGVAALVVGGVVLSAAARAEVMPDGTWEAHGSAVSSVALSGDGRRLGTATGYGDVRITGLSDGAVHEQRLARGSVWLRFSDTGDSATAVTYLGQVYGWDARTGIWSSSPGVAIQDGTQVVAVAGDRTVVALRYQRLVVMRQGHNPVLRDAPLSEGLFEPAEVTALALTSGGTLAIGRSNGSITVWDLQADRRVSDPPGGKEPVTALAFAPDSSILAVGTPDGTIGLRDSRSGRTLRSFQEWALTGHPSPARAITFSPDGKHLAAGRDDGYVRRWSLD